MADELEDLRLFGSTSSVDKADDQDAKRVLMKSAVALEQLSASVGASKGLLGVRKDM